MVMSMKVQRLACWEQANALLQRLQESVWLPVAAYNRNGQGLAGGLTSV